MVSLRLALVLALALFGVACKRVNDNPLTGKSIRGVRFAAGERMPCTPCDMIVTVDTAEFHITETTGVARIGPDSTWVVFTSFGGAGGYRGSGQAMWRYDVTTGKRTQIMSEYYLVEQIEVYPAAGGGPLLIVSMREPMQLTRHVAIVDPLRGEIWRAERSAITATDSTGFTVTEWGPPVSWLTEALNDSTGLPRAAPLRTYRVDARAVRQMEPVKLALREWGQQIEFEVPMDTNPTMPEAPAPVSPDSGQ